MASSVTATTLSTTALTTSNVTKEQKKTYPAQNMFRSVQSATESSILIATGFMAIFFNITVVSLLLKKKRQLKSFEILLLNLASADILVGMFAVTSEVIRLAVTTNGRVENVVMAVVFNAFAFFFVISSILNVLCISIDRFIAVKFPMEHRGWVTRTRTIMAEACIWVVTILLSCTVILVELPLQHANNIDDFRISGGILILLSGTVFTVMYGYIIILVRASSSKFETRSTDNAAIKAFDKKEILVFITCALVVLAYLVFTYPFGIEVTVKQIKYGESSWEISFASIALLYFNSVANPFVYFFKKYLGKKNSKTKKKVSLIRSFKQKTEKTKETVAYDMKLMNDAEYGTFENKATEQDDK